MPQPKLHPFNHSHHRNIYPMQNSLGRGYAVSTPNASLQGTNARFINVLGEYIDFYIEDIQADFSMAGSTGQSRTLRQFFPHNFVQPSIVVSGTQPNSHQYNRLAAFIRVTQHLSLSGLRLGNDNKPVRTATDAQGNVFIKETVRLLISNGTKDYNVIHGRNVKGIHKPWRLEGYIKSMQAGAEHFQQAPQYQFEFLVAKSQSGIWKDHAVLGDQIRSWTEIFNNFGPRQGFISPSDWKTGGKGNGGKGGGAGSGGKGASGGTGGNPPPNNGHWND